MSAYAPGTVYLVTLPFEGGEGGKRRPVVLVGRPDYWAADRSAVVCPVTTVPSRVGDVAIDWRAARLERPSRVRPRPQTIAKARMEWKLGSLGPGDLAALKAALRAVLDLDRPAEAAPAAGPRDASVVG